jgi:hypothetical protein
MLRRRCSPHKIPTGTNGTNSGYFFHAPSKLLLPTARNRGTSPVRAFSQDLAKPCCPDSCWLCFERPALRHQLWLKHKQRTRLHHFALRLEFFTEIVAVAPGQHGHNLSIGRAPISALRCDDRRRYLAGLDLPFALSNFIRKRSARTMWGQVPMVRGCTELRSGTCRLRGDRGLSYSHTPAMASPAEGPH